MKESAKLRFLDKYIGSLICLVFSIIHFFKPKKKEKTIKNILVIELFEMGAATMICPSLNYIKKKIKDANIYCLTLKSTKGSWQLLRMIPDENMIAIDDTNLLVFFKSLFKSIILLRKKKIDLIVDFELFMRVSAIISFLIKSKFRAGFYKYGMEGLYRGNFYDFKSSFNQNSHISKNFLALTKTALNFEKEYPNHKGNIQLDELSLPKYKSDSIVKETVKEKIKSKFPEFKNEKIIVVCPAVGNNLMIRNYPKENFVRIVNYLVKRKNHLIVLIGTQIDWPIAEYIRLNTKDKKCINFCGKTNLTEVFELINMADLLISNDNGPIHFASITQTKTLAIFSTDSPFIYGPLGKNCMILYDFFQCSPCISAFNHKSTKCKKNLCLQSLAPEKVFKATDLVFDGKIKYGTINNEIPYIY